MLKPCGVDVAVLLIFFAREEPFRQTFEPVRRARPKTLLLYQDGPRPGRPDDVEGIRRCRRIAEDIDWQCEVHTFYQTENVGCDPSEYIAQKWAFGIVDECVVLEDDDVVCDSFFPFCRELLERYRDDPRVNRICGMNNLGVYKECPYDYFFSSLGGSPWGWASWKRVVDGWDAGYGFLDDGYAMGCLAARGPVMREYLKVARDNRASGRAHYETILSFDSFLNSRLTLFPAASMVCNVGNTAGSTHTQAELSAMPRRLRRVYHMETRDVAFPLRHPPHVLDDPRYARAVCRQMGYGRPLTRLWLRLQSVALRAVHGDFRGLVRGLTRRIRAGFLGPNRKE